MESIMDYLEVLEELVETSRNVPFSTRISVDRDKLFELINEMRMNIPNEIRQAQRIIEDHDKIITEARSKAAALIKDATMQAHDLVDDHEVYKMAVEQSQELMEETKKNAKEMRLNAMDYADEILLQTENSMRDALASIDMVYRELDAEFVKTVNVIYSNRQELRGSKG
ncbi:MAG: ATPase [Defluviitaleaceae bacterium]|nr:ATPase [Defluviitaleaceae bacterium]